MQQDINRSSQSYERFGFANRRVRARGESAVVTDELVEFEK